MRRHLIMIITALAIVGLHSGCSADRTPSSRYPVTTILDPVTEETPNVITNR